MRLKQSIQKASLGFVLKSHLFQQPKGTGTECLTQGQCSDLLRKERGVLCLLPGCGRIAGSFLPGGSVKESSEKKLYLQADIFCKDD